jgi:NADH pyrophosphatase NudC (nudix superfamily)
MTSIIQVERDHEGLHTALVGLFEEAFQKSAIEEASRAADKEQRKRMLDEIPARSLSPGYYARATYILDLGRAIETGVTYSAETLAREDVRGLQALARAKAEFEREHPACSGCGTRQDNRFAMKCRGCGVKFTRGGND